MATVKDHGTTKKIYNGYPWVGQSFLPAHFSSQATFLAERMTFLEVCKQREGETMADFESRCKFQGCRCEYTKMKTMEKELIRDRFITGRRNVQLQGELLRHRREDGSVGTLEEVLKKAKCWRSLLI